VRVARRLWSPAACRIWWGFIKEPHHYKLGVSKIKKIGESKYKKEFRSMSFAPRNIV
jgi:hypothetical protein